MANKCNVCGEPVFATDDDICDRCEEIMVERSRIIREWLHYEGCMPPAEELPKYPKRDDQ